MRRLFAPLLLALLLTACVAPELAAPSLAPMDSPTQGGVTVKTDYSAYTPHTALEPLYTRLSEDFISELQASEDYGQLYPFAGSTLTHATEDGYGYQAGSLYGMVDRSGRIVVDPVYTEISMLHDWSADLLTTLPFWLLSRTSGGEDTYYGDTTYAIASLDGSFVTDCIYSYVTGCSTCLLAVQHTEEGVRFDLFDLKGRVILRSESLSFRDELLHWGFSLSSFGEELITLPLRSEGLDEYGNQRYVFYFMDLEGNLILGPYQEADQFSDGRAAVLTEDGDYAYIDRDGNIVCRGYSYATTFSNGIACVVEAGSGSSQLIDTGGRVLLDTGVDSYIRQEDTGFIVSSSEGYTYYDSDCNLLYNGPVDHSYNRLTRSGIFQDISADDCTLYNASTGQSHTLDIEHFDFAYQLTGLDYFWLDCWDRENQSHSFILMDDTLTDRLSGAGQIRELTDPFSDEILPYQIAPGSVTVYDAALNPLFEIPTSSFERLWRYGDRICCTDAFACSYYDLEGKLLFRYPLTNAMED